jgi:hypothetical protein
MAISIPSECRKFKAAVTPLFVCILVLSMLGLFGVVLSFDGLHFDRLALAVASMSVLTLAPLMAWLSSVVYPASFSADGIYGHSFWGRRRFVRWQDVAVARTFRLLNLRWLRIYTTDYSKVIWLALFPANKVEFLKEIHRLAPSKSPIFKHLE